MAFANGNCFFLLFLFHDFSFVARATLSLIRCARHPLKTSSVRALHTAILAGISGTKKTSELIPLCHPLPLDSAKIEIAPHDNETLLVTATAKTTSRTGVEMEALTGASTAALTLYDMCKAAHPAIVITDLNLVTKTGGKSDYQA